MRLTLTILKSYPVICEGEKPQQVWQQAAFFMSLPQACPVEGCGAELQITYRHPTAKVEYYGLLCTGNPPHECNLGEYEDGSGLFWKGNTGKHAFKLAYGAPEEREPEAKRAPVTGAHAWRGTTVDDTQGDGWNCSPKNRKQVLSLWGSATQLGISETDLRRMLGTHGCTSRKELSDQQAVKFAGEIAALVRERRSQ
jgi:hypothetical protein